MIHKFDQTLKNSGILILGMLLFTKCLFSESVGDKNNPLVTLNYLKKAHQFVFLTLDPNEKLKLEPGVEFIFLSGKCYSLNTDQMLNLTQGDLMDKKSVIKANHLHLILPGKSGEGESLIQFKEKTTFMVRGRYTRLKS